ncbi:YdbL family protein [Shewanella yunxiaonensis]|uniref:YdbL family protein n=1 Tax=Shewanella yunxiaonensis TaxID=2829809 RepID=A0ABX7YWP3_9GAMM|nr:MULTISPECIES: YdbL family protein [Shewanella]MDF0535388.1 YdbL family protein [Shewanella sp. A32]QUN07233.1 YdbL family protein [Shewanella yunxiaonensis]
MTTRIMTLLCAMLLSFSSFAISLQEAKDQGLVGEQLNGYLAVVKPGAGVAELVKDINAKRQAQYEKIARQNGISVDDVAKMAAAKVIAKAEKGHMVQDNSGNWVKK